MWESRYEPCLLPNPSFHSRGPGNPGDNSVALCPAVPPLEGKLLAFQDSPSLPSELEVALTSRNGVSLRLGNLCLFILVFLYLLICSEDTNSFLSTLKKDLFRFASGIPRLIHQQSCRDHSSFGMTTGPGCPQGRTVAGHGRLPFGMLFHWFLASFCHPVALSALALPNCLTACCV